MILRLILKKGDSIETKDIVFYFTANEMNKKTYYVDHFDEKNYKEIVESEVIGVEKILTEIDK